MAKSFSDQLRRAMDESGLSQNRIAGLVGVHRSALSRFYRGERGLPIETIDKVCKVLRVRLVAESKPAGKAKRKKGR